MVRIIKAVKLQPSKITDETKKTHKQFLKALRKVLNAKRSERIDKRYNKYGEYLAPDNNYYKAHCGYCAEANYLGKVYEKGRKSSRGKRVKIIRM